jgi:hypothetical protein
MRWRTKTAIHSRRTRRRRFCDRSAKNFYPGFGLYRNIDSTAHSQLSGTGQHRRIYGPPENVNTGHME